MEKFEGVGNPYSEGLGWLLEHQMANNPEVINAIVLNIYKISSKIKDVELLTDYVSRRMLIWVDLDVKRAKYPEKAQKKTETDITTMLMEALPSYQFRIVFDRSILDKSIERLKELNLKNGKKDSP